MPLTIRRADGGTTTGMATALLETAREVALIRGGGMIPTILRRAFKAGSRAA